MPIAKNSALRLIFLLTISTVTAASTIAQDTPFLRFVKQRVARESDGKDSFLAFDKVCPVDKNPLARRVLFEYGSMFVAAPDVKLPNACIFETAADVASFHTRLETKKHSFDAVEIELQAAAMKQLIDAQSEAGRSGLSITPLDGSVAGRRTYQDTVRIWNSRFYRALDYWVAKRRIAPDEADEARLAPVKVQIDKVVEWESKGCYFSTNFSKSIFRSVAPPGTSQHLSMLAFDVAEVSNAKVRTIMNKYGWYQTIRTDQPHFTFLGVPESELPSRGLQKIVYNRNTYWVPQIEFRP